jgi:hypothetical protein
MGDKTQRPRWAATPSARVLGLSLILFSALLSSQLSVASVGASGRSLSRFGLCLGEHGVPTTLAGTRNALALPSRLPAKATLDTAFAACRRFVQWPRRFVHVGRTIYRLHGQGRRFRACMRRLGWDSGAPVIVLFDRGIGLQFPNLRAAPPRRCARELPNR